MYVCMYSIFSPNEREPLFLGQVIDSDLFEEHCPAAGAVADVLPRPEHIYLEADFDLLGERALREDGLHLRHHSAVHHAAYVHK